MNPLALLALVSVGVLLGVDWLVKKRKLGARADTDDGEFLLLYRGPKPSVWDEKILLTRHRMAKELGLPPAKLSPNDRLADLRDRYCLAVSGYLALGDLFEDLRAEARTFGVSEPLSLPETVRDYIVAALNITSQKDEPGR